MRRTQYLMVVVMALSLSAQPAPLIGRSFLSPRSQSTNAARELVGWREFINRGDACGFYGALSGLLQYGRSFRSERIGQYFFGSPTLVISGSNNTFRADQALLADYFGLSPDFLSEVTFAPQIKTALLDIDWYGGWGAWYLRAHMPLVWTKTSFGMCETVFDDGAGFPFPPLYMDDGAVVAPASSFKQAISGQLTYGQVTQGLQYGRIACEQSERGISDLQIALGYNIRSCPLSHLGLNVRFTVPTGNRSKALFLLEPMIGNGHHFEFGFGFTGHWTVWEKDCEQQLAIYLDLNIMHLFASRQVRSFDFGDGTCNKRCGREDDNFASRYMLVKMFNNGVYSNTTMPAINVTTLPCRVHNDIQVDLALMFSYISPWIDLDLGYGAWVRSREKISLCDGVAADTYGFKGIQNVALAPAVPSPATQTKTATIFGNYFIDQAVIVDVPSPQLVSVADLDLDSAANPTAFTHKLFWNVSHAWKGACIVMPFVGFGGEVEFSSLRPDSGNEPYQNTISQWALWIKGGIGF